MKFHIHTYGCQMNVRDSEAAEALLVAAGHEKAASEADAELVIVNSCTVRQKAEEKAIGKAGNLCAAGKVTGLMVQEMEETYGLGEKAMTDYTFLMQYLHTNGEAAVGEDIDAITGATVTSKAVTKAVNSACAFVTGADVSSSATEWGNW